MNPHDLRHYPLKIACLPIPPPGLILYLHYFVYLILTKCTTRYACTDFRLRLRGTKAFGSSSTNSTTWTYSFPTLPRLSNSYQVYDPLRVHRSQAASWRQGLPALLVLIRLLPRRLAEIQFPARQLSVLRSLALPLLNLCLGLHYFAQR